MSDGAIALILGIISIILIRKWVPIYLSVPILAFKFGIPLLYKTNQESFQPYHILVTDGYYLKAAEILSQGHSPIGMLLTNFDPIRSATGSMHPFYWWWNATWINFVNGGIFAIILINVFLMVIGSLFATLLVKRLGYSYKYQQLFMIFTLIHVEVITWSSFVNMKDPFVALLTMVSLYLIVLSLTTSNRRVQWLSFLSLCFIFWLLLNIRFYIPVLFLAAISIWWFTEQSRRVQKPVMVIFYLFGTLIAIISLIVIRTHDLFPRVDISSLPFGILKFPLTPRPWGTAADYSFLIPAATFHWILAPIAILGMILLSTKRLNRLLLVYVSLVVLFYATVPLLMGPRHRFQLVFLIGWIQFHGLWSLIQRRYQFYFNL